MAERYSIPDHKTERALGDLGESIASWRKLHQLTQEQLAKRAGISRPVLTKLERGDEGVGIGALFRVLRVLQLDGDVLEAMSPFTSRFGWDLAERTQVQRVRPPKPKATK
ncbi:MAG TPA: helix-turn-helix transcriptional regulator [Arachnia sp.]|jgi:transcriptional regulator with XRE-family HTH domain|nr:helix-turn-helix transcriptional regulator [Propionibacteriaceae bacterium]HOA27343.1 helix-turn-helix transcriptional regulator [Arachnia sp.]HQD22640.1 helix-turn-helix transcriptional regulator [Arachnia sp.]